MFYLAAYTLMVAGSFGVVTVVGRRGDDRHDLSDYRGLGRAEPLLAFAFMVFLLAQAGVPFTSGFLAKFYVLGAAIDAHSYWLALVAMLSSVISAYLYLRIITTMYADSDSDEAQSDASDAGDAPARKPRLPIPAAARAALVIAVVGTIGLGLVPGPLHDASRHAVPRLAAGR
jgi:NADH-quinone oxidoreductase subunit N